MAEPDLEAVPLDFYPRPPRGGRRQFCLRDVLCSRFLSTPSARRATAHAHETSWKVRISIHALREEGDDEDVHSQLKLCISIHALREEGDLHRGLAIAVHHLDFYPRPPRGGRLASGITSGKKKVFLSTPSARRATQDSNDFVVRHIFLSTPSARRATQYVIYSWNYGIISIHALREEGDSRTLFPVRPFQISIHALREEGDCMIVL